MSTFSWKALVSESDHELNQPEAIYRFGENRFGHRREFYSTDRSSSGIYDSGDVPSGAMQIGPDESYIQIDDEYLIF